MYFISDKALNELHYNLSICNMKCHIENSKTKGLWSKPCTLNSLTGQGCLSRPITPLFHNT